MSVIMRRPINLTLVRHGETTLNVQKVIQGHTDAALSKNGESQAELLGKHIADHKFTRVFSSDLCRAHQTAQLILKHSKHGTSSDAIVRDPRLRERCYGEMEGKHFSLLFEEADKLGVSPAVYTPKGGETSEEANQRVKEFFMELCTLADNDFEDTTSTQADGTRENILVVSHGGVLKLLMTFLQRSGDSFALKDFEPSKALGILGNTGTIRIKIHPLFPDGEEARQKRSIVFTHINDLSHLEGSESQAFSWDAGLTKNRQGN